MQLQVAKQFQIHIKWLMLLVCYVYIAVSNDSAMIIWISNIITLAIAMYIMGIALHDISKTFYVFRMHTLTNFKCMYIWKTQ